MSVCFVCKNVMRVPHRCDNSWQVINLSEAFGKQNLLSYYKKEHDLSSTTLSTVIPRITARVIVSLILHLVLAIE